MQFVVALESYLSAKEPETVRSYRTTWSQWEESNIDVKNPTLENVQAFLVQLRKAGLSDGTIRLRFQTLNSIYDFLYHASVVDRNPFRAAARLISWRHNKQVRPTKLVPAGSIPLLINGKCTTKSDVMHRGLLSLLFGSGLRINEARTLTMSHVMTTPEGIQYVTINDSKAGKIQHAAIPTWAWEHISVLVSQRKSEGATGEDSLFTSYYKDGRNGGTMSTSAISRLYKRLLATHGLEGYAPHSARATFATQLLEQGFRDDQVAQALRHSNTDRVCVYDKRRKEVKKSAALDVEYDKT